MVCCYFYTQCALSHIMSSDLWGKCDTCKCITPMCYRGRDFHQIPLPVSLIVLACLFSLSLLLLILLPVYSFIINTVFSYFVLLVIPTKLLKNYDPITISKHVRGFDGVLKEHLDLHEPPGIAHVLLRII